MDRGRQNGTTSGRNSEKERMKLEGDEYASAERFWNKREARLKAASERRAKLREERRRTKGADAGTVNDVENVDDGVTKSSKTEIHRQLQSERTHDSGNEPDALLDLDSLFHSQKLLDGESEGQSKRSKMRQLRLHAWLLDIETLREEIGGKLREYDHCKFEMTERKLEEERRAVRTLNAKFASAVRDVDHLRGRMMEALNTLKRGTESVSRLLGLGWRHLDSDKASEEMHHLQTVVGRLMQERQLLDTTPLPTLFGRFVDEKGIGGRLDQPDASNALSMPRVHNRIGSFQNDLSKLLIPSAVGGGSKCVPEDDEEHIKEQMPRRRHRGAELSQTSAEACRSQAETKDAHKTAADVSRLRAEYLEAVQRIKLAHDRNVRQLQRKQRAEVEKLSKTHEENLRREVKANEDAAVRLLSRLGVTGDTVAAFIEGFQVVQEGSDGSPGCHGGQAHANQTPAAQTPSSFALSQSLASERHERQVLEARLLAAETDASTAREYALFKQRQHYEEKLQNLERDCEAARGETEKAKKVVASLKPMHDRLMGIRQTIQNRGAAVEASWEQGRGDRGQPGETDPTDDGTHEASKDAMAESLMQCLEEVESDLKDRVGLMNRDEDAMLSAAAVTASHEIQRQKRQNEDRVLKREQEYDDLLSELRHMEKKFAARDVAGADVVDVRGEGERAHDNDDVELAVSSTSDGSCSDDDTRAASIPLPGVSGGSLAAPGVLPRVRDFPPQPRRFLPKAVTDDPERRIRRRDAEKIHPGIQRLLLNSQRIVSAPHPPF